LVQTPGFATYRRCSRALEVQCRRLEQCNVGGAPELLKLLANLVSRNARVSVHGLGDVGSYEQAVNQNHLKREAFKVEGDMSAAIKLLVDYALPSMIMTSPEDHWM
jgi:hypothetical protein